MGKDTTMAEPAPTSSRTPRSIRPDTRLDPYRAKRSKPATPEPVSGSASAEGAAGNTFVIQEHHARRLHWDFRLERDGVLVSWAIPKGLPDNPKTNHLAIQTEDHPLEYASFEGEIPRGQYGAGTVTIVDRGTYECEKWTEREVKVWLRGRRVKGHYVLFRTSGRNWMIHQVKGTAMSSHGEAVPRLIRPMLATLGQLPPPAEDDRFGYEMKWDGVRAVMYVEDGRVRLLTRNDIDVTVTYPELAAVGAALRPLSAVLDGEIVAYDESTGWVSFAALQSRMHLRNPADVRRIMREVPVTYQIFDLLFLDGRLTTGLTYAQRRELLESLDLSGPHWATPPYHRGGGEEALAASRKAHLEGVVAKRLDSVYEPGQRSRAWIKVKNLATQEVVVGGWRPGQGTRAGRVGSFLVGIPAPGGLEYVGHVGTGFTEQMLDDMHDRLRTLARDTSPFVGALPASVRRGARWVEPVLVGEVRFSEWTRDGRLRHPAWRGLRPDKAPEEVSRADATPVDG